MRVLASEVGADPASEWCRWEGGIHGLYAAARSWTDAQLEEALRRFERGGLAAEADGIRGEQSRREQVQAGKLEPREEDLRAGRHAAGAPSCAGCGRGVGPAGILAGELPVKDLDETVLVPRELCPGPLLAVVATAKRLSEHPHVCAGCLRQAQETLWGWGKRPKAGKGAT